MSSVCERLDCLLSSFSTNWLGLDIGKSSICSCLFCYTYFLLFSVLFLSRFESRKCCCSPQVGQVVRPKIEGTGLWHFTRVFARAYDYGMGVVLFAPLASLAWLPIISAFQTRFLFNEAFSRRLQIQPILAGKKKH